MQGDLVPVNGRSAVEAILAFATPADEAYHPCAEAFPSPSTPRGKLIAIEDWQESRVYARTKRDVAIYLPAQLQAHIDAGHRPALCVFQDGPNYSDPEGDVRAPAVFDTLIHKNHMPVTVAIFLTPGTNKDLPRVPRQTTLMTPEQLAPLQDAIRAAAATGFTGAAADELATLLGLMASNDDELANQRSVEYDTCDGTFVRFLETDLLPMVEARIGIKFTADPARRAICGMSSGGICAFNAAWQRPDLFGVVLSHVGSYTNIRGGHEFPFWVRGTPRKPIRVVIQSGERDADLPWGSWPLANKTMADALSFAGYDCRFDFGVGGHNLRHGGALFATHCRWMFRDHGHQVQEQQHQQRPPPAEGSRSRL